MYFEDKGIYTEDAFNSPRVKTKKHISKPTKKPNISYAELIAEALENTEGRMLTLKGIYQYVTNNYPYFSMNKAGWQNSIRHNLSLNKAFYKVPRGVGNPGKGSYWKINYENFQQKQGMRTKRVSHRKYNGCEDYIGQQTFLENIGVTEVVSKNNVVTVFEGNLSTLSDCNDQNVDLKNPNFIFSFK